MDIKTVMGFILIGLGIIFEIVAKFYGIDGAVDETFKSLIAMGLFLLAGKELYNLNKK